MGDAFFPFARNKDWYEGHSWAAGVVPFGAGRNQVECDPHLRSHDRGSWSAHSLGGSTGLNMTLEGGGDEAAYACSDTTDVKLIGSQ